MIRKCLNIMLMASVVVSHEHESESRKLTVECPLGSARFCHAVSDSRLWVPKWYSKCSDDYSGHLKHFSISSTYNPSHGRVDFIPEPDNYDCHCGIIGCDLWTEHPTNSPTNSPVLGPGSTYKPTISPTTSAPTTRPTTLPTVSPTTPTSRPTKAPLEPACDLTPLDIVWLVDASKSISNNNYNNLKQMVGGFGSSFNPATTRFGLVQFGSIVYENYIVRLDDDPESTPQGFIGEAEGLRRNKNAYPTTNTEAALKKAEELFLDVPVRPNGKRVLIVATDGLPNHCNDVWMGDDTSAYEQATECTRQAAIEMQSAVDRLYFIFVPIGVDVDVNLFQGLSDLDVSITWDEVSRLGSMIQSRVCETIAPTTSPTTSPSAAPTPPTQSPTRNPTSSPTTNPTANPTTNPTSSPSKMPTTTPTTRPTTKPTTNPTINPTTTPTLNPSTSPTNRPTTIPTSSPSENPTSNPTSVPSTVPTGIPTTLPTISPSLNPTTNPTTRPTATPTNSPTSSPSEMPTTSPTSSPTTSPTIAPSSSPTTSPSQSPTPYGFCSSNVMTIVDQSFSIYQNQLELERAVVTSFLNSLYIQEDGTNVGFISFNTEYYPFFMFDDDSSTSSNEELVTSQIVGFLNSESFTAKGYTDFRPLFTNFAPRMGDLENPSIVIISDGVPHLPNLPGTKAAQRAASLAATCPIAQQFRRENPNVQVLCFQSPSQHYGIDEITPFFKDCACDAVWLVGTEEAAADAIKTADLVANQMRNFVCVPEKAQENPCTPINDQRGEFSVLQAECEGVQRTTRGTVPLENSDITQILENQCEWDTSTNECVVKPEYAILYPTSAPTNYPTISPTTNRPSVANTARPTLTPSSGTTRRPSISPTINASPLVPSAQSTDRPTTAPVAPTKYPTFYQTNYPTISPTTQRPTISNKEY